MRHLLTALTLLALVTLAPAQGTKTVPEPPLLTRWAKDVKPDAPWPEYPRPQMARDAWMNLNGTWQWTPAKEGDVPPFGQTLARDIVVPFPIESVLSGVGEHHERIWYRRTFVLPTDGAWDRKRVLLHFGGVDWEARVFINGREFPVHRGGYDSFSFDISQALRPSGEQEIIVGVWDPTDKGEQRRGKQVLKPEGIWYTPVTGIWQTVWVEPVSEFHVRRVRVEGHLGRPVPGAGGWEGSTITVTSTLSTACPGCTLRVTLFEQEGKTQVFEGRSEERTATFQPLDVMPWSPESPYLYDIDVELLRNGGVVDKVRTYVGVRSVALQKDDQGVHRLFLNGKPCFMMGPLDQGYWPDGLYTAPTDEALRYDLEVTKQLGFNMTRKHIKVEPARWYSWADKLGLLVWQDMPSGSVQVGGHDPDPVRSPEFVAQFDRELQAMIENLYNHPSIVMWVAFNEGMGQFDTPRVVDLIKRHDPSRLINNASGWTDRGVGDVIDWHVYPAPAAPPTEAGRAAVLGEFGGLGLSVPGHRWSNENWGYKGVQNGEALTSKYEEYLKKVYDLRDKSGLAAAVYTQITDVEIECNGLLTYDRAVIKCDVDRVAAVNRGDFSLIPPPPIERVIVPTSEEVAQEWRYTTVRPAEGWEQPGADRGAWNKGPGGFGTRGTPGALVGTEWASREIWIAREVELPEGDLIHPHLRLHHDEDCEVYINGVLAAKLTGYTTEYDLVPLRPEASAMLRPGKATIAVRCRQTGGGQFIDVGLVDVVPRSRY